jgi:hypothetical protein
MSEFNGQIGSDVVNVLNRATDASSTWQLVIWALTHDAREPFLEVLNGDSDVEEALMLAPLAEQLHMVRAINVYWRSQTSDVELPRSPELSQEGAFRAEFVAARVTYEMLKLRGHHRQPTIEDLFRMLR